MKKIYLFFIYLALIITSCSNPTREFIEIKYELDLDEFINPGRGFYRPFGTKASNFKELDIERLRELRNSQRAAGGFEVGSSLTYRNYQLGIYKDKPLSNDILIDIQKDLDILREVGNKMILRFSYSDKCCDPPFDDAPKNIILLHLGQLKPLLTKNKDVIAVV